MSDNPMDVITAGQRDLADITDYEYDVFIIFATPDKDIAMFVCQGLEQHHLRCIAQFKQEAFAIGNNVVDNIVFYVTKSKRTLLLLTRNSMKNNWVTLETILALEESHRCNNLRLRMLVHDISESELGTFKSRGLVASVPHCRVDFNKENWHADLVEQINVELSLPDILPVGSMAHGLVFSHYVGFLSFILPVLKEEIAKSKICQKKPWHVSKKYYMLLPGSCKIYHNLASVDEENGIEITKQESVEFERQYVGKPRTFKITLYKITKGREEFYFFADFPHVLNAMFTMKQKQLADVDIQFQIARFYYTINEMINHAENQSCHNTVQLILFNENVVSMQEELWKAVSDSIPEEVQDDINARPQRQPIERLLSSQAVVSPPVLDATICCYEDSKKDTTIALDIEKFLKTNHKTVEIKTAGTSHFQLKDAKWSIFILSKDALKNCRTLSLLCDSALICNMDEGEGKTDLHVLVVIVDIEPREVPRAIRCVNMLKAEEPNFCAQILRSMNGEPLRMEHKLPCGDVATGLAWAYVINYLKITLLTLSTEETGALDFAGRIKECLKDNGITVGCIPKMFIILPKSCKTTEDLAGEANKGFEGSGRVTTVGTLLPVYQHTGGQLGRPFKLHMFMHTNPETSRSVCFIAEYCTPAKCMREMVDMHKFAGLQEDEMVRQCKEFARILPDIIKRKPVKEHLGDISDKVELIFYDDKKEPLISAIERHIQAGTHNMVFAKDRDQSVQQDYHLP